MDLEQLLESVAKEAKLDLDTSSKEVAAYAVQRAAVLATQIGLPGYQQSVIAERDNVALFAGLHAVGLADKGQAHLVSVIQGALAMAARALVAA